MRGIDRVVGGLAVLLAVPVAIAVLRLDLGTPRMPGPGLWPLLLALALAALGVVLLFRPDPTARPAVITAPRWGRLGLAVATLLGYALTLERLGYLGAATLLLVISLRWVEGRTWRTTMAASILAAGISFVVFRVWLRVPLPAGVLSLPGGW